MYPIYFKLDEIVSAADDDFDDDDLLDEEEAPGEDQEMSEADHNHSTQGAAPENSSTLHKSQGGHTQTMSRS